MSSATTFGALSVALKQRKQFIEVDDLATYKRCRVQLHAKGVVLRDVVQGVEIRTKRQQVCRVDDFIVAEIDAKVGGYGLVPTELDGAIVSSHYFLFDIDRSVLDPRYLALAIRTRDFLDQIVAKGSTNYAAVRPADVLRYEFALPSIGEQHALVAWMDRLATQLAIVQHLHSEMQNTAHRLLLNAYREIVRDAPRMRMADVAPLQRRPVQVEMDGTYEELGIRSFGRGTFHKAAIAGAELGEKRIYHIAPGDLLFNIVFAWEGAVAVAKQEDAGRVGSHRFLTCVPRSDLATAGFLRFHLLTETGLEQLGIASPGGAGRNRTLGLKALARLEVPTPHIEDQLWFDRLQSRVHAATALVQEAAAETGAIVPAVLEGVASVSAAEQELTRVLAV